MQRVRPPKEPLLLPLLEKELAQPAVTAALPETAELPEPPRRAQRLQRQRRCHPRQTVTVALPVTARQPNPP